jgi:hypothetical protein
MGTVRRRALSDPLPPLVRTEAAFPNVVNVVPVLHLNLTVIPEMSSLDISESASMWIATEIEATIASQKPGLLACRNGLDVVVILDVS